MGWRDKAKQAEGTRDNRDKRDNSPANGPNGPIGSIGPPLDPARAMKLCEKGLAGLEPAAPLHGLSVARWRQLMGDAHWLLDAFARSAFHDGWTVGELFGLWPGVDGAGGIADRLQGSRSLLLVDDRARWRSLFGGVPEQFNRTAYPDLRPMWEPQQ